MEKAQPLVSVVVPVYNGRRYIAEAIESVLAQDYAPLEIVVVDDESSDDTSDVIHQAFPQVSYHRQVHAGAAAARNRGVEQARGEYVAFLDSDDVWEPHKITRQIDALRIDPAVDLVFGHVQQFISPDLEESVKATLYCPADSLPGYIPGAMLLSTETFRRVGPFETRWEMGEFIAWYSKAMDLGLSSLVLPEVVLRRRLHSTNQGVLKRMHQNDYLKILKATLDRRRAKE